MTDKIQNLTNKYIGDNYGTKEFNYSLLDILAAFSSNCFLQTLNDDVLIDKVFIAIKSTRKYLFEIFRGEHFIKRNGFFLRQLIDIMINAVEEIKVLNNPINVKNKSKFAFVSRSSKEDVFNHFIDLDALSREITYGLIRSQLIYGDIEVAEQNKENEND